MPILNERKESMPATREQLIARWETPDGQQLAELACEVLYPSQSNPSLGLIKPLDPALVQRLRSLPFAEEVAEQVDLRGLHLEGKALHFKDTDLSNVRLDYAFPIDIINNCRVAGAVFDRAFSVYGTFPRQDLSGISLADASFNGGMFYLANLSGANLQGAHLALTNLSYVNGSQAIFIGADLRFSDVHHVDFSGADLREADFTEANVGDVTFDAQTRVQGANFRGASLSDDFRTFARQRGAQLDDTITNSAKELVQLDATLQELQRNNTDGHLDEVIALVKAERDKFERDPDYPYYQGMEEAFARAGSPQWIDEVMETWMNTGKRLAHFL